MAVRGPFAWCLVNNSCGSTKPYANQKLPVLLICAHTIVHFKVEGYLRCRLNYSNLYVGLRVAMSARSPFRGNAEQAISGLIEAIYDAAIDPEKWQAFVNVIERELDGVAPVFYLADTRTALMETLLVADEWGERFLADYMHHFNALNPWTPHLTNAPAIGQAVSGDDVIMHSHLKETEFYNDFFRSWGDWTGVVGVVNYRDRNAFSVLGLHCSRKMFERKGERLSQLIEQLSPHITRAFEISRILQHGAARKASLEATLDHLAAPALLVGADFRVRYANPAAQTLFTSSILVLDHRNRIAVGSGTRDTDALRTALKFALSRGHRMQTVTHVVLARPDDLRRSMPLVARVMPCDGGLERPHDTVVPFPIPAKPEVLVLITDPAAGLHLRADLLRNIFGLTPAEARLAQSLAQKMSLKGYAAAAGITDGTARVQLKAVFAKTGTHSQAELVTLLARLAEPFRSPHRASSDS